MANEPKIEEKVVEKKPKPDCPICKGAGFVVLVPGTNVKVVCTCKYK